MPEIKIRPAQAEDIPSLLLLDHDYTTDRAWQMDIQQEEDGQIALNFRPVRLPRSVQVAYPRDFQALQSDWQQRSALLVAELAGQAVAYLSLSLEIAPQTAWVTDLVVLRRLRRQGIGTALLLAAQQWASSRGLQRMVLEMCLKNSPAMQLGRKLGFEFCGYNDRYYATHDIALFFGRFIR